MKLIGIVGRVYYNRDLQNIIQLNDSLRRVLANYSDVVSILLLPTNYCIYSNIEMGYDKIDEVDREKLDYILDKCDGFIVPGGTYFYKFDEYVINYAIRNKKPLLGICAGFQAVCSMYSTNRDRFDMTKKLNNDNHYGMENSYVHNNIIINNTLLFDIIGRNKIKVNSLHHDYIDFDMKELIVSSYSEDGIIEAVELDNHPFFLGIQWHPEYLDDDVSRRIFDKFIDSIKELQ